MVGNDRGGSKDTPLRYARRDAGDVARVLKELGGVSSSDVKLLLDEDASAVRAAFAAVDEAAKTEQIALVFYYSGHADGDALHLGSSTLPWTELDGLLRSNHAALRIAFADACQSGMLVRPKGLKAAVASDPAAPRGTAVLVATTSIEAALESESLGGSFFTHYLVSGLRGAADADGDLRVTLAEAQAYAARQTQNATAGWSPATQHPTYDVDISGQREVVLTDLHHADARITFDPALAGDLLVATRDSSETIVAELIKTAGASATIALPSGRYRVYLRESDAVLVGDVSLPWGGESKVTQSDLARHSYYEVAQKGARLDLHRIRVRAGGALGWSSIAGVSTTERARIGAGIKLGSIEWGVELDGMESDFTTVDTEVKSRVLSAAAVPCYERIERRTDIRLCGIAELAWWRQDIARTASRQTFVPGLGLGVGIRLPLTSKWFAEPDARVIVDIPSLMTGVTARPRGEASLSIGLLF